MATNTSIFWCASSDIVQVHRRNAESKHSEKKHKLRTTPGLEMGESRMRRNPVYVAREETTEVSNEGELVYRASVSRVYVKALPIGI